MDKYHASYLRRTTTSYSFQANCDKESVGCVHIRGLNLDKSHYRVDHAQAVRWTQAKRVFTSNFSSFTPRGQRVTARA
jgi:hypothetical protein